MRRVSTGAVVVTSTVLLACATERDARDPDAGTDTGPGTTTGPLPTGAGTTQGPSSETSGTGTTGGPFVPDPLCDGIELSLVLDPGEYLGPADREAIETILDRLVVETGATVRVRVNVGTEGILEHDCFAPPALAWGTNREVDPGASGDLSCALDTAAAWSPAPEAEPGDGAYMWGGLMTPILQDPAWPATGDGVVSLAVLSAATDDRLGGMYSRPGMASEAFIRLAGAGDRRRVAALAVGTGADELHTFALSLGESSRYHDRADRSLGEALADWTDVAITACDDHDREPTPPPPKGCTHLDVLFVVDGSFSMDEEQRALRGTGGEPPVFKGFTDALLERLEDLEDIRVGVISSAPGDTILHTHADQPELLPGPDTDCGLPPDQPWVVAPSPDFETQFACLAGTDAMSATDETTALNAAQALVAPENEGFLRDDSIVFVVMLTDEDTQGFTDTRVSIRERILAAVGDRLDRLVVLGISGDPGVYEMPLSKCWGPYGDATPGRRLGSIVRSFRDRGLMQDICQESLALTFDNVLEDVVHACQTYQPPPG